MIQTALDKTVFGSGLRKKLKKTYDAYMKFKKGDFVGGVKKLSDLAYHVYDKDMGKFFWGDGFNFGGLKVYATLTALEIVTKKDGYIQKNEEKYQDVLAPNALKEGNLVQTGYYLGAEFIQTVGKGSADVICKTIDKGLHSLPIVGDGIDFLNAFYKDAFGYSPGQLCNDIGTKISDGVDFVIDNGGKIVGKAEKSIRKFAVATGKNISSGIKKIGKFFLG